jgi:hypothetical protein
MDDLLAARHWLAKDICTATPVIHTPAIIDTFTTVRREAFLGEGP